VELCCAKVSGGESCATRLRRSGEVGSAWRPRRAMTARCAGGRLGVRRPLSSCCLASRLLPWTGSLTPSQRSPIAAASGSTSWSPAYPDPPSTLVRRHIGLPEPYALLCLRRRRSATSVASSTSRLAKRVLWGTLLGPGDTWDETAPERHEAGPSPLCCGFPAASTAQFPLLIACGGVRARYPSRGCSLQIEGFVPTAASRGRSGAAPDLPGSKPARPRPPRGSREAAPPARP
jgi:hypothetical protein